MLLLRNPRSAATAMSQSALELKFLFHDADDAAVASTMQLYNSVFCPEPGSLYISLEEWKRRLSDPTSSIIYLAPQPNDPPPLSGEDQPPIPPPVAFIFAYQRSHPEPLKDGTSKSLHIRLAGVLEEYRGRRCLDTMVNALIDLERNRRGSESSPMSTLPMTVCTNPSRFPSMWSWLRARTQWVLEKEFEDGKVMFSWTGWDHAQ